LKEQRVSSYRVRDLIVGPACRGALVVLAAAGVTLVPVPGTASALATTSVSFTAPGDHIFVVPAGVQSVTVTAIGAAGGGCGAAGGRGAQITGTVAVTPGEQLYVGVGGVGGDCSPAEGSGAPGPGGIGGGGRGGAGTDTEWGGGGGGGASLVGVASPSPGFSTLLVVAGGGGGRGGPGTPTPGAAGGDAGAPGASTGNSGGGAAGTQTAGGAGGSGNPAGADGSFGMGGQGADSPFTFGGGGGGGGYYGGGGGGAQNFCCSGGGADGGGGGGGGSSFTVAGATNVTGPTPTSAAAKVTIRYPVPTADPSKTSLTFGTQPQATVSPEQTITVTNNGSADLVVSGAVLGGTNPGDYLLENGCQQPVAAAATCVIGIRFAPQAQGASAATLTLLTNAPTAPSAITLSGSGGSLPQGPPGATGQSGPPGPAGPQGKQGPPGKIELITCREVTRTVKRHGHKVRVKRRVCRGRTVSGILSFTVAGAADRATLSRGRLLYATGASVSATGGRSQLVLSLKRPLRRGRYVLTLSRHRHSHTITQRRTVTMR
jgi:hypothetical protein